MEESTIHDRLTQTSFLLGLAWGQLTALRQAMALHGLDVLPHEEEAYKELTSGIDKLYYANQKGDM